MGASQSANGLGKHSTAKDVVDVYKPDLKGKVAIVTGGNSGIGLETCKALASAGARVVMCSRNVDNGEKAIRDEIKVGCYRALLAGECGDVMGLRFMRRSTDWAVTQCRTPT